MKHELSKERLEFYANTNPPFGYTGGDIQAMARALLAAHEQEPVATNEAAETLQKICNIFRIGIQSQTQSTILANVENAVRFAEHLHAIEREFFMVPGEPDEDYPDDEPSEVCLVNCWGTTTEQYVEQFRAALVHVAHAAPSIPAAVPEPVSQPYKLPDGYALVPVDATRAMIDAARRVEEEGYDAMHKAMIAAAPKGV